MQVSDKAPVRIGSEEDALRGDIEGERAARHGERAVGKQADALPVAALRQRRLHASERCMQDQLLAS